VTSPHLHLDCVSFPSVRFFVPSMDLSWFGVHDCSFDDVCHAGEFNVCICSDVLSRGINIETIDTVVNMDLPEGRGNGGSSTGGVDAVRTCAVVDDDYYMCSCS